MHKQITVLLFSSFLLFFAGFVLCPASASISSPVLHAKDPAAANIPDSLAPWIPWVLHGHENLLCPDIVDGSAHICSWAGPVSLNLDSKGGTFAVLWHLLTPGWIYLPGSAEHWPMEVRTGETLLTVVKHLEHPAVYIKNTGSFQVQGNFSWNNLPESILLPEQIPFVAALVINGTRQKLPDIIKGRLWLRQHAADQTVRPKAHIDIRVYRLIRDTVPMIIKTRIDMQISGESREITLGWKIPENQIPVRLESALPVRINKDRRLTVNADPGHWSITCVTRTIAPSGALNPAPVSAGPWPDHEYWVFEAHPEIRTVSISGVIAVDPSFTTIPREWRSLPAYIVKPGDRMVFSVRQPGRGDSRSDSMEVARTLWLDQDGGGLTSRDIITGTVNRLRRLDMAPSATPGRVSVNGADQLVTRLNGSSPPGVELRPGNISVSSVYRIDHHGVISATGWLQDMKKVHIDLFLPPGWQLLHADGVDRAATWVNRWSLFDIFIVLLIFIAVMRLYSWSAALASITALVLVYHEPDAPVMVWLLLLAVYALKKAGKGCRFYKIITTCYYMTALLVIMLAIPFAIQQIRYGVYPQLEQGFNPQKTVHDYSGPMTKKLALQARGNALSSMMKAKGAPAPAPADSQYSRNIYSPAVKAMIQTGPGLPAWNWKHVTLSWSGPVGSKQRFSLLLLSPMHNLVMAVARTVLLFLMVFMLIFREHLPAISNRLSAAGSISSVLAIVLVTCSLSVIPSRCHAEACATPAPVASAFPPEVMLDKLRSRLAEPPECMPSCASVELMKISADRSGSMRLLLWAGALADTALPLPRSKDWHIISIRMDNEQPLLVRHEKNIYIFLGEGRHEIEISTRLNSDKAEIFLPELPHLVRVHAPDWKVTGINHDEVPDRQISFVCHKEHLTGGKEPATGNLPPFLSIKRILQLGIEWHVDTVVKRLSPRGAPVILDIPLLDGESVITDGIETSGHAVHCSMGPDSDEFMWRSCLAKQERIRLKASDTTQWLEIWELRADPLWHVELSGITPVFNHDTAGQWFPHWMPWPGQEADITVSRPEPVKGATKTVDSTLLTIKPGLRITDVRLEMSVRSSRGDSITVTLPQDADLQEVMIDSHPAGIRQQDRKVEIPLHPGGQQIQLSWREPHGITRWFVTPKVSTGVRSVNSTVEIMPGSRWIWYLRGPVMGPAILFYSEIAVLFVLSILLGISRITPLRAWHWMLLAFGLSQSGFEAETTVAAWLILLGVRERYGPEIKGFLFNMVQIVLVLLTLAAFGALSFALRNGLLGQPDMLIAGNGSMPHLLRWYCDRTGPTLPRPALFSLSISAYRAVMLAWALWLACEMINWLRWGWNAWSKQRLWDRINIKLRKKGHKSPPDSSRQGNGSHEG